MWITHDQLCELYDRLEAYRHTVPFYKFLVRYTAIVQRDLVGNMIETLESIAKDQGETAVSCGCYKHSDPRVN